MASQYKSNLPEFNRTAHEWTRQHARDLGEVHAESIRKLVDMGFLEATVRLALERSSWDEQTALNLLLTES